MSLYSVYAVVVLDVESVLRGMDAGRLRFVGVRIALLECCC
jgi:hypothetical protein